jgi:hypothetical protein
MCRYTTNLYSGVLATKLNANSTFVPHVTVGAFESYDEAERVVRGDDPHSHVFEEVGGQRDAELRFDGSGQGGRTFPDAECHCLLDVQHDAGLVQTFGNYAIGDDLAVY